jgi:hypothetical protein
MNRFPILIIVLNLVPVYGVFEWGWSTFDLIFLYWIENVIIGVVTVGRMLLRGRVYPNEGVLLLFLVPFFMVHYGGFTWGHGVFVVALFGKDIVPQPGMDLIANVVPTLEQQRLWGAVLALLALNLANWLRDIQSRGMGADNPGDLMTAPYRRIVVLHVVILLSGFAITAANEPLVGLLALILVKTASDLNNWRKDEQKVHQTNGQSTLTPEKLRELETKFPQPYVELNGRRIEFDSFAQLKASNHFRTLETIMRMAGASKELDAVNAYLDMKIAQEIPSRAQASETEGIQ